MGKPSVFMVLKINRIKIIMLGKAIYRHNVLSIKIPRIFFSDIKKNKAKFMWKHSRSWITKVILNNIEKCIVVAS